jgi:hypothetical protein
MIFPAALILALGIFLQADWASSFKGSIFTPKEIEKLQREEDINDRIKIYTDASKRIQKRVNTAVSRGQFKSVPGDLELWTDLLTHSYEDIKAGIDPNKKSRNLIKYEIQVRRSLDDLQDNKIKAPLDLHGDFETCLNRAEAIRKKFVEIIFPR